MEVWGSLSALREVSSQHYFGCMNYLGEVIWIPWYLHRWKKDSNVFDLLWKVQKHLGIAYSLDVIN